MMADPDLRSKLQSEKSDHRRTAAALSAAQRDGTRLQRELDAALADLRATAAQRDKLRELSTTLQRLHRAEVDAARDARDRDSERVTGMVANVSAKLEAYGEEHGRVAGENARLLAQVEQQAAHLKALTAAAAAEAHAGELRTALEAAKARQAEAAAAAAGAAADDARAQLAHALEGNAALREQAAALSGLLPKVKEAFALVDGYKAQVDALASERARLAKRLSESEAALGKMVVQHGAAARDSASAAAAGGRLTALARALQDERAGTRARVTAAVRVLAALLLLPPPPPAAGSVGAGCAAVATVGPAAAAAADSVAGAGSENARHGPEEDDAPGGPAVAPVPADVAAADDATAAATASDVESLPRHVREAVAAAIALLQSDAGGAAPLRDAPLTPLAPPLATPMGGGGPAGPASTAAPVDAVARTPTAATAGGVRKRSPPTLVSPPALT